MSAVSADGSRVAFVRTVGGTERTDFGDLYAIGADGTHEQQLSPPGSVVGADAFWGSAASWSPDGKRVAFAATLPHGYLPKVYVVDADGSNLTVLYHSAGPIHGARWSPDGQWIAFESGVGESSVQQVLLIHHDGTGGRTLTPSEDGTISWDAQWSPNGSRVLFQRALTLDSAQDLWTANADGSDLVQLTHDPGRYEWYSWGP